MGASAPATASPAGPPQIKSIDETSIDDLENEMDKALCLALGVSKPSWRCARLLQQSDGITSLSSLISSITDSHYMDTALCAISGRDDQLAFLGEHTSQNFLLTFSRDHAPFLLGGWLSEYIIATYGSNVRY